MMIIYLLSTSSFFSRIMTNKQGSFSENLVLIAIFGAIGALGNNLAVEYNGALVNTRIIGVAAGGIYGGPVVGVGAAIIAVINRILIGKGGFTLYACCISTILEGYIAGYVSQFLVGKSNRWLGGMFLGAFCEILRKGMVLLVSRPLDQALDVVKVITLPMTLVNSLGLGIFVVMVDKIFEEQERLKSEQARICLNIANKTLPILRKGLNYNTALAAANIIYFMCDFDAVSITSKDEILSYVGLGDDHHNRTESLAEITKKVLNGWPLGVAQNKADIGCKDKNCKLQSAVVVPLKNNEDIIGTLKLYRCRQNSISDSDIELGMGLAHLFSTQLELSILDEQAKIITQARIKMLQSQMNPHFLFNSLNTISVLCRINPLKARDVIKNLSVYYRKNLKNVEDLTDIRDELEHVKAYLAIEKARFNTKLNVNYDIDHDVDIKIPPLTIQAIVENAVNHGILPKSGGGNIWIIVKDLADELRITVKDDGVGMKQDLLTDIKKMQFPKGSYGLALVVKRLLFTYGDRAKFEIESEPDKGTNITFTILKSKAKEGELIEGIGS
jgi:two-component system sensor histidine kinase LytS